MTKTEHTSSRLQADGRLLRAFSEAEGSALQLVTRLRLIAMGVLSIYLFLQVPGLVGLYWAMLAVGLGLLGVLHYMVDRSRYRAEWPRRPR